MEGIELAIVRGAVAGKLRAAARGKDEKTAAALMRAASRYSAGACEALAQMGVAGNAERSAPGPIRLGGPGFRPLRMDGEL